MKNVLLPIPADASQLYAIRTAGEGKSFVLHGPPGTGKSQTITAMIANALAQGKTVLFVAEKMAALSVVQRRLDDLGLGPFCMELHSNKARKKTVLNQLRAAMEVAEESQAEGYLRKSQQAAALRTELDAYAEQLHTPQTCGYSLYELLNLYEDYADADNLLHFNTDFVAGLTADKLEDQTLMAERLISAAREVGHPAGHPLSPIGRSQYSQRLRADLPVCLQNYREALETLSKHGYTFTDAFALEHPADFAGWNLAAETAAEVEFWESVPASWTRTKDLRPLLRDMRTLCSHGSRSDTLRAALLENWNPRFLEQDAKTLKAQWNTAAEKWIVPRLLEQNKLKKHLAGYANHPMDEYTLLAQLDQLEAYQLEISTTETLSEQYAEELQDLQSGDWEGLKHFSERISQKADVLERLAGPDLRTTLSSDSRKFALIEPFRKAWESFLQARTAAIELLELSDAISEDNQDWLSAQIAMCDTIEAHQDDLKPWMVWLGIRRNCEETGLHTICKAYDQGIAHDVVQASYYKALYRALIIIAIDDSELLSSFSGAMFNEKIEQFRRLDQELRERSRQEIYSRLVSRVSGLSKSEFLRKEFAVLQKAIRSGGRGLSIRRLFEQIPNLLPQLCPCMLMSPISAAQYLDPCRAPFDLVVFDEASQLPTCKAVGALARGENAVIVGDPKQMPPTSFFTTNIEDEDNLDQEDLESILDDCLTLDIPQTHLRWHYRSRHESLIAFSNNHFYENKLYTFPSVNDRASRVSFVRVDGCFDRGRTRQNRAEAEAVVSEIIRRSKDPVLSRQSIGVVTFNIRQQTLIADLFDEACRKDADLDHWADHAEEPLFIKNLENVQGDERDVILFSVSYGPDKDGKLSMNFGPLNRSGGWRRLNVAVSRARCEMVVFSTMTSEQINLSRSAAEGVEALKAFLEYAEKGRLVTRETSSIRKKPVSEGIADSICRTLHEYGFETQKNVGHSEYRIDIGVIDPKNPETYLLGILLDGSNYRDAKTTTDRELAQISVLEGLGWKIHRIWSMDWWDNHQKELRYLLSRLDELQEISIPQPDPEDPADSKEEISETEEAPDALAEDFTFSEEMDSSESENALGEARDTEDTASDHALHNPEETDESSENALHQPNEMDYTAHGTSHTPENQDTVSGTQLMHDTMTDRTR